MLPWTAREFMHGSSTAGSDLSLSDWSGTRVAQSSSRNANRSHGFVRLFVLTMDVMMSGSELPLEEVAPDDVAMYMEENVVQDTPVNFILVDDVVPNDVVMKTHCSYCMEVMQEFPVACPACSHPGVCQSCVER